MLHVEGNAMGARLMREIIRDVKFDFLRLRSSFPGMMIVWSDMVGRTAWRWA